MPRFGLVKGVGVRVWVCVRESVRGSSLKEQCAVIAWNTVLEVLISIPSTETQRPAIYVEKHLRHLCANRCVIFTQ